MQTRLATILTLLCVTILDLSAQAPASMQSLSIEAHESGTVSSFDTRWEIDSNNYDRDNHQGTKLLVTVRDLSRKIPRVEVQIFFIGRDEPTRDWLICKRVEIPIDLKGLLEVTGYVESPLVKSNEVNYGALGQRDVSGTKLIGWIVRGTMNGKVFQTRASNQTLLELAEGSPQQSFSLEDLIANYEKSHRDGSTALRR